MNNAQDGGYLGDIFTMNLTTVALSKINKSTLSDQIWITDFWDKHKRHPSWMSVQVLFHFISIFFPIIASIRNYFWTDFCPMIVLNRFFSNYCINLQIFLNVIYCFKCKISSRFINLPCPKMSEVQLDWNTTNQLLCTSW